MTVSQTTRLDLYIWSAAEDEFTREQMTSSHSSLENNVALFTSGTDATPPTASTANTNSLYWDTTNNILHFRGDDSWQQLFPVQPSGHVHTNLQPLDADLTALSALTTTGIVSRTAADTYATRSIAVSGSGLSVSNAAGLAGDPTITINSASAATASTIVLRDANARFQAASPSANADVAIKSYVDTADALKANSADVYTKTELHNAKLYQYANTGGGTGTALPSSGTRTTPRIYVQSTDPGTAGAITGDIWFQI